MMHKLENVLEETGKLHAINLNTDFSNLMTVDKIHLEKHRVVAHLMRSPEADTFRILRTHILQVMNNSGFKTLAVTSPDYSDGKTTVALNLAMSIALDLKQTALLADLDLRKPTVHEFLGVKPAAGLSDYLMNKATIPECLIRLSFDRITILPAGRPLDNSSEVLGSPKMAALACELKTRYADRFVIYDMPPALEQDDPLAFLPNVDAVLLVVRDGVTNAHRVTQCLNALSGANVIGTVLNNSPDA
jgi:hypothetical protein